MNVIDYVFGRKEVNRNSVKNILPRLVITLAVIPVFLACGEDPKVYSSGNAEIIEYGRFDIPPRYFVSIFPEKKVGGDTYELIIPELPKATYTPYLIPIIRGRKIKRESPEIDALSDLVENEGINLTVKVEGSPEGQYSGTLKEGWVWSVSGDNLQFWGHNLGDLPLDGRTHITIVFQRDALEDSILENLQFGVGLEGYKKWYE